MSHFGLSRDIGQARIVQWFAGLALTGMLAAGSIEFGRVALLGEHGISSLTIAIVFGIAAGNTLVPLAVANGSGVTFSKQWLLRLGIVLYGLRLTFRDIATVGVPGIAIDTAVLTSTFALSWFAGTRMLGLDRKTAMLIGAGSAICGAAAVMAAAPVVRGRTEQVAIAVSTVVLFGTLSMFLYPVLYAVAGQHSPLILSPMVYGVFAGSTIHEVAQVVVAGHAASDVAANAAVITKMVRVMMLAPFLVILSACLPTAGRDDGDGMRWQNEGPRRIVIPWFALAFLAVIGLNSLFPLPQPIARHAVVFDEFILGMAMAGLGLTTRLDALVRTGVRPLVLAALLFTWLIGGGMIINLGVWALAGK
ncbi:MAG: YeiH family protein [Steroidobacteraceae bacterium]